MNFCSPVTAQTMRETSSVMPNADMTAPAESRLMPLSVMKPIAKSSGITKSKYRSLICLPLTLCWNHYQATRMSCQKAMPKSRRRWTYCTSRLPQFDHCCCYYCRSFQRTHPLRPHFSWPLRAVVPTVVLLVDWCTAAWMLKNLGCI